MRTIAVIVAILFAPLVIGWVLRVTGISKGPASSGDSDGGFVDMSSSDSSGGGSD